MEDKKLAKEVAKYSDFEVLPSGKIHCNLTGHDLMPRADDFKAYLASKSYKMAQDRNHDFTQYAPHQVDYNKDPKKLYCRITHRVLDKLKSVVEKHVNGRKYKKTLEEYLENQTKKEELKKKKDQAAEAAQKNQKKAVKKGKKEATTMEEEGDDEEGDHLNVEQMDELYGGADDEEGGDWEDQEVDMNGDDEDDDDADLDELEAEGDDDEEEEVIVKKTAKTTAKTTATAKGTVKTTKTTKTETKVLPQSKKIQKVEKVEVKKVVKKQEAKKPEAKKQADKKVGRGGKPQQAQQQKRKGK